MLHTLVHISKEYYKELNLSTYHGLRINQISLISSKLSHGLWIKDHVQNNPCSKCFDSMFPVLLHQSEVSHFTSFHSIKSPHQNNL